MRRVLVAVCAVTVALTAGCAKDRGAETAELKSTIESMNARFAEAFSHRDVATLGQLYAADAQAYPPGTAPVVGRPAIQDMWKGVLGMSGGRIQLRTIEVDGNGETAWEAGRYTLIGSTGGTLDDGKYIVVWKREAGSWKLYRDMWSSDSPQQAAPSAAGQPATNP